MTILTAAQRTALERAAAHPDGTVTETGIVTRRRLREAGLIADVGGAHRITDTGRDALKPATQPWSGDIRFRQVENFQPGQWFLYPYEEDGTHREIWAEVNLVMHMEQFGTGRKFVRVLGVCTDNFGAELVAERGQQLQNVTAQQARKAGLRLPEVPSPDASRNPQPLPRGDQA